MLVLVLHDHPVHEAVVQQGRAAAQVDAVEHREGALAHLLVELPRLGGREDVETRPLAPGVAERVVHVVEAGLGGRCLADRAHQPQLLVVADVREVPAQRRHQW